jgi:hypothetical protein
VATPLLPKVAPQGLYQRSKVSDLFREGACNLIIHMQWMLLLSFNANEHKIMDWDMYFSVPLKFNVLYFECFLKFPQAFHKEHDNE